VRSASNCGMGDVLPRSTEYVSPITAAYFASTGGVSSGTTNGAMGSPATTVAPTSATWAERA